MDLITHIQLKSLQNALKEIEKKCKFLLVFYLIIWYNGLYEQISSRQGGVIMAARCEISGKGVMTGHRISITRSHVSRRANRTWKPNLKKIRVMDENGSIKTMKICVKELRNLKKSKKYSRVI